MRDVLSSLEHEYRRYKGVAERAFEQVTDAELLEIPAADGNSMAMVAWHVSGNLKSRFTDFLTSDGEKPWRDRESEFATRTATRAELSAKWEEGWTILFRVLSELGDDDLSRRITIRAEELSVLQALHRSLAHASYHVGQVVLLAKSFRGETWRSATIPKRRVAP